MFLTETGVSALLKERLSVLRRQKLFVFVRMYYGRNLLNNFYSIPYKYSLETGIMYARASICLYCWNAHLQLPLIEQIWKRMAREREKTKANERAREKPKKFFKKQSAWRRNKRISNRIYYHIKTQKMVLK